jgi:hypothetical protein
VWLGGFGKLATDIKRAMPRFDDDVMRMMRMRMMRRPFFSHLLHTAYM